MTSILASALVLSVGRAAPAGEANDRRSPVRQFDLRAQPLEDALIAFADQTGIDVFVDHSLAAGQVTVAVQGSYDAEQALRLLLGPTGLTPRRAADGAFTLVEASPEEPPVSAAPAWFSDRDTRAYFALLQSEVRQALCTRTETMPGDYRAALAIWIDGLGRVVNVRILGLTPSSATAQPLVDRLLRISLGRTPPAGISQPITLVVLPRSPDRSGDCH